MIFRFFEHVRLVTCTLAALCSLVVDSRVHADSFRAQIIEGTPTSEGDYPYVARLNYEGNLLCTGTLITPKHVLTAAHCFFGENKEQAVGDTGIVARLNGEEISSERVTIHPSYRPGDSACVEGETDAAIVELSREVSGVTPVPLLTSRVPVGATLTIVGYGTEGTGSSGEGNSIPSVGLVNFGPTVVEGFGANSGDSDPSSLYYYWRFDRGESNTATGDSGGPAFYDVNGERFISGITCGGDGNAEYGSYSWNTRADLIETWAANVTGRTPSAPPPASTPVPAQGSAFTVSRGVLQFDGTKSDFLEISGAVFVGNNFSPRAKRVIIAIGGYRKNFRFDRKGQSIDKGQSYFDLRGAMRRGKFKDSTVNFKFAFERVSLFKKLSSLGFYTSEEAEDGEQALMPVNVTINGLQYQVNPSFGFDLQSEQWQLLLP